MPTKDDSPGTTGAEFADGYGYDARVLPRKNVLLTTSFTGWNNYTRDFGDLTKDAEAMKHFGNSMVLWDFHARQPKKRFRCRARRLRSAGLGARNTITPSPPPRSARSSGFVYETRKANGRPRKSRRSGRERRRAPCGHQPERRRQNACLSIASATANAASSMSPIRRSRDRSTKSKSANR